MQTHTYVYIRPSEYGDTLLYYSIWEGWQQPCCNIATKFEYAEFK